MTGVMQENYVHGLPRMCTRVKPQSRRLALVFRQGEKLRTNRDNGAKATSLAGTVELTPEQRYPYGSHSAFVTEGKVYRRTYLLDSHAFGSVQGGVSGTKSWGCNAIVVSRQEKVRNEHDTLDELAYTSNGHQGGGRLFTSFKKGHAIRVFRTSALEGPYRACQHLDLSTQMYRYDGLYFVKSCTQIDDNGETMHPEQPPVRKVEYTFLLCRLAVKKNLNRLSLKDLRREIRKGESVGVEDPNSQLPLRLKKGASLSTKRRAKRSAPETTAKLVEIPSQSTA
jgi:SAD/SRA domain